ncbi:MAG: ABC transporter ATP-binding protein [Planctomycetota bacterium]|nr:MAG: ABC transporter ATP-binding protein [Planctomycetota bacterium]
MLAIRLQQVTKIYRHRAVEVRAVDGVTADVAAYQFTVITGPSGSGKSTLLQLIGALDRPSSGRIIVAGRDLSRLTPREQDTYRREQVGFVFQDFNLLSNLTALENVLVPFLPVGITAEQRRRAERLLGELGLADRMTHKPRELSGGEQQRVAIARALLKDPDVILADEPTGELDSETGRQVFALLRRLCHDRRTTVVVITHDRSLLESGDRILQMRDGRLVGEVPACGGVGEPAAAADERPPQ